MNIVTKVNQVESYIDSQGTHQVVKGKLVLISVSFTQHTEPGFIHKGCYKPIIISETDQSEQLIKGDSVLFTSSLGTQEIFKYVECDGYGMGVIDIKGTHSTVSYSKSARILALPEQFSSKHLQVIVDGKLKDGDEVLVECIGYNRSTTWEYDEPEMYIINTNQQNHIKLFPIKKEESWDEIISKYYESYNHFIDLDSWLKANYNPPTKK